MKSCLRVALVIPGLLLIAAGIGVIVLRGPIKNASRSSIEETLTRILQARTTVDAVALSPWKQTLELRGIAIWNPEGYKEGVAVEYERVVSQFDLSSLLSETPTVDRISLEGGQINLRYEAGRGVNLKQLAENASEQSKQADPDRNEHPRHGARGPAPPRTSDHRVPHKQRRHSHPLVPRHAHAGDRDPDQDGPTG